MYQLVQVQMPLFSQETLEGLKLPELREISKEWNIGHGKMLTNLQLGRNKSNYLEKIWKRVETMHTKRTILGRTTEFIKSRWYESKAPLHDTYFNYFNIVDICDGYYYACNEQHPNYQWKSKMLQAIMRLGVINVWGYYIQTEYMLWLPFRQKLADILTNLA